MPPPVRPPADRWNPALAALALGAVVALGALPFVSTAPNRLVSGEPVGFVAMLHAAPGSEGLAVSGVAPALAWAVAGLLALMIGLAAWPVRRWALRVAVAASAAMPSLLLALAASQAEAAAQALSPIARTSLGSGFWLAVLLAALMAADALQRLAARGLWRGLVMLAAVAPIAWLLASGQGDGLSLMKEYANRSDVFAQAVGRHLQIVGLAIGFTLALGLPLGWAAHRRARVGRWVFPVLNIVQTVPSIALFGLLMAPLAWLALQWPALGRAGIGGVGLAPGVIALVLYSLLPVVRGMLAGLAQVPAGVLQAATGMGMNAVEIFWRVQVPLALPVVLAGVRTAAIQAVGLAAVTALIGAGGLGTLMFEGLFSNAQDLVLLGVLPIVALGVAADALFKVLDALASRHSRPGRSGRLGSPPGNPGNPGSSGNPGSRVHRRPTPHATE